MPPRLGMIADDLTGACDAGVQFQSAGLPAVVCLEFRDQAAGMTVLTTDSRADSPDTAASKVREACHWLERQGIELVYKKIDSTLCGNVAAEVEAALAASGREEAWVCPAFPAMGRTVSGGWLLVNGVPRARVPAGPRVQSFDAVCDEDLARIVERALRATPPPLLAGSAGLAAQLARKVCPGAGRVDEPVRAGRVVVCAGSANPVTAAQLERLKRERPSVEIISINWDDRDVAALADRLPGALVLTGGDTARRVCGLLKARAIRLQRELLPGIPVGRLIGGEADGVLVVTKAGGFGDEDALLRVMEGLES